MSATPLCPHCGSAPWLLLDDGRQAFCGDERCDVLAWNPMQSIEELEASKAMVPVLEPDWERS